MSGTTDTCRHLVCHFKLRRGDYSTTDRKQILEFRSRLEESFRETKHKVANEYFDLGYYSICVLGDPGHGLFAVLVAFGRKQILPGSYAEAVHRNDRDPSRIDLFDFPFARLFDRALLPLAQSSVRFPQKLARPHCATTPCERS